MSEQQEQAGQTQQSQPPAANQAEMEDHIAELQNSYSNVKVFSVVPMGVLMILYFFTFATLIDRGMYGLLSFEIATTILFFYAIFTINKWPVNVVKWRYKNKQPYSEMLNFMDQADFTRATDVVVEKLNKRQRDSVIT